MPSSSDLLSARIFSFPSVDAAGAVSVLALPGPAEHEGAELFGHLGLERPSGANAVDLIRGAAPAHVAVLPVDGGDGVSLPDHRRLCLLSLLGIPEIVLLMDGLAGQERAESRFRELAEVYRTLAEQLGLEALTVIPVSLADGDNVSAHGERLAWYTGPTLAEHLRGLSPPSMSALEDHPLRLPVAERRTAAAGDTVYRGVVAAGRLLPAEPVRIQPSGEETTAVSLADEQGELPVAVAGQNVTVTLNDPLEIRPGDVISAARAPAEVADQFECHLLWAGASSMLPGRPYRLRIGTQEVSAMVTALKYRLNVDTLEHLAASTLERNEIGVCNISLDRPVAFEPYSVNRTLGGFQLLDEETGETLGAGMLHFALRRAHNIHHQPVDIDQAARARQKGQQPVVLWFTGLSGAGKSTVANRVERQLYAMGCHSYLLDGDNVRHGLNRDLGFTDADRVENIRRVAEVAKLMTDAGLIVLTAFISPFRAEREQARMLVGEGRFFEIFIDTPLAVAEQRDVKGLYRKARRGELKNFTGIDSPYEPPEMPALHLETATEDPERSAQQVIDYLHQQGII